MSDQTKVLTVFLDKSYKVDDILPLISAIRLMNGVIDVGHVDLSLVTELNDMQTRRKVVMDIIEDLKKYLER